MNLQGSIDLLKLERAGVATIKGLKCLIIPIEENDIYITADEDLKAKGAFISLSVCERREISQYGKTHYAKQSVGKDFRENNKEIAERKKSVYLGDFKPFEFEAEAQPEVSSPEVEVESDDLPF
ncbi:MAG: hypothetical protein ACRCZY_06775 [Phocaeicola sp.]